LFADVGLIFDRATKIAISTMPEKRSAITPPESDEVIGRLADLML